MNEDKISLKQILLYEKAVMHPLNRMTTYVITPIYLGVALLLIIAFAVLMEIDDEKYLVVSLCFLALLAIFTVVFLSAVPFIRKKVLRDELDSYSFDFSDLEHKTEYEYSFDDSIIKFDKYGMYVEGHLFYYNHLYISVVTNNYCHRILIDLRFALDDENFIQIRLDEKMLKMISDLHIPIQNEDILNYILNNKEDAFKQIYNKGYLSIKNR